MNRPGVGTFTGDNRTGTSTGGVITGTGGGKTGTDGGLTGA